MPTQAVPSGAGVLGRPFPLGTSSARRRASTAASEGTGVGVATATVLGLDDHPTQHSAGQCEGALGLPLSFLFCVVRLLLPPDILEALADGKVVSPKVRSPAVDTDLGVNHPV